MKGVGESCRAITLSLGCCVGSRACAPVRYLGIEVDDAIKYRAGEDAIRCPPNGKVRLKV